MSERDAAPRAAAGPGAGGRVIRAWGSLSPERRMAAFASIGLLLTLFLPWYQQTVIIRSGTGGALVAQSVSITGWAAFALVEVGVVLVALGVLVLLFQRAEGRGLQVPGGDGVVVLSAGSLAAVLIVWGIIDKQGTSGHGQYISASGVEWGIFVALAVAALLAYAGSRMRAVYEPPPAGAPGGDDGGMPFWGPGPEPEPPPGRPAPPADEPTRVSTRRRPRNQDEVTRVPESARPSSRIGPRVVPDGPPTTPLDRAPRGGAEADEPLTLPLEQEEGEA